MAKIFYTDGTTRAIEPNNGHFKLEELQSIVNGYIEPLPLGDDLAILNEEASHIGLEYNENATIYIQRFFNYPIAPILGNVVIIKNNELQ